MSTSIKGFQKQSVLKNDYQGAGAGFVRFAGMLWQWYDRALQRRRLADLTPWLLDDIGVTRDAAAKEAAKPFWRD